MRVPTDWSAVTIKQYYNLLDALDEKHLDSEPKAFAILSAVTSVEIEDLVSKVPASEVAKALHSITFISKKSSNLIPKVYFKLKGRKFFFEMAMRDSLASAFIDVAALSKEDGGKKNMHSIISIFCHELNFWGFKKKRTINSQKEIAGFFKENMTMDHAFAYSDFFLRSFQRLQKGTVDYLERMTTKAMKITAKNLKSDS